MLPFGPGSAAQTMHQSAPCYTSPRFSHYTNAALPATAGQMSVEESAHPSVFGVRSPYGLHAVRSLAGQCSLFDRVSALVILWVLSGSGPQSPILRSRSVKRALQVARSLRALRACNSDGVHWLHIGDECALLFPCGRSHGG